MTHAERWTIEKLFTVAGEFENARGQRLDELLAEAQGVTFEGSVWPRWTWTDGSAIVARFGCWDI